VVNLRTLLSHGSDREVIALYAGLVGVAGILCFVMMYARYFGASGEYVDAVEAFIIFIGFFLNVVTYWFLLKTLRCKDRIRRRGSHQIKLACRTAREQILSVLIISEQLQTAMNGELRRAYDAAKR